MTKAALNQLTRNLAVEWAKDKIRVNAVSPWYTATDLALQVRVVLVLLQPLIVLLLPLVLLVVLAMVMILMHEQGGNCGLLLGLLPAWHNQLATSLLLLLLLVVVVVILMHQQGICAQCRLLLCVLTVQHIHWQGDCYRAFSGQVPARGLHSISIYGMTMSPWFTFCLAWRWCSSAFYRYVGSFHVLVKKASHPDHQ